LAKGGVTSSAAALGSFLASQAIAAPAGLAAGAAAAALAGSTALAASAGAQLGLLALMTTKTTAWLAATAAVLALGYAGYQHHAAALRGEEAARTAEERIRLQAAPSQSEQRPAALAGREAPALAAKGGPEGKTETASGGAAGVVAYHHPLPPNAKAAANAERMAQMKPLLASGVPIKGAVIVLVDGKPVQRPVEFVMGRETRIDAADDGTYVITPALNEDGSVRYAMVLLRKDPGGGPDQAETLPFVIQTPWEGFTLGSGNGQVMAFDPDGSGP
jgi:hypothetical protein